MTTRGWRRPTSQATLIRDDSQAQVPCLPPRHYCACQRILDRAPSLPSQVLEPAVAGAELQHFRPCDVQKLCGV